LFYRLGRRIELSEVAQRHDEQDT
ncbi:uncharacterized protein METZ01_LOCUS441813, partial [marine metagenome]